MPKFHFSNAELDKMYADPYMPDRERRAFDMYYKRGMAIEDIAAEMGYSRGTINNLLRSARHRGK